MWLTHILFPRRHTRIQKICNIMYPFYTCSFPFAFCIVIPSLFPFASHIQVYEHTSISLGSSVSRSCRQVSNTYFYYRVLERSDLCVYIRDLVVFPGKNKQGRNCLSTRWPRHERNKTLVEENAFFCGEEDRKKKF